MKRLLLLLFVVLFPSVVFADTHIVFVNTGSTAGGTGRSPLTTGTNRAYVSLQAAITGEVAANPSLVALGERMQINLAGSAADTTCVDVAGFTVNSSYFITITSLWADRHSGKWNNSIYRLSGNCADTLKISTQYTVVQGIQIENTNIAARNTNGILVNASDVWIKSNLIYFNGTKNGSYYSYGINIGSANNGRSAYHNNIIYGFENGIVNSTTQAGTVFRSILNNTIYTTNTGRPLYGISFDRSQSGTTYDVKNNLIQGYGTGYNTTGSSGTLNTASNITFDNTSPDVSFRNKTANFVDLPGKDLHLAKTDSMAKDSGTNVSDRRYEYSDYAVVTDIDDQSRMIPNDLFDIGADEIPKFELCANGIDDDEDPVTSDLCPGSDKDWDGYPYYDDCDDTDRSIFPGVSTGCDAGTGANSGWKTCNSGGGWTACTANATTPLCEKTGSGHCYYIDPVNGSDTTGSGTYASPWKTWLKLVTYYLDGDKPSGWTQLVAGDVIYLKSGTYDSTQTYLYNGERQSFFARSVSGTSSDKVVIKNYPGNTPVLSTWTASNVDWTSESSKRDGAAAVSAVKILQSNYWVIEGLTVDGQYGNGVTFDEGTNVIVRNNIIRNTSGYQNNNLNGINVSSTTTGSIYNNIVRDNYDWVNWGANQKTGNNSNIVDFRVKDLRVSYNRLGATRYSFENYGTGCYKLKHANQNSSLEFDHNLMKYCWGAIEIAAPNVNLHHNIMLLGTEGIAFKDLGGTAFQSNERVYNNTFIGITNAMSLLPAPRWGSLYFVGANPSVTDHYYYGETRPESCMADTSMGPFYFYNNLFVDNTGLYNNEFAVLRIGGTYASDYEAQRMRDYTYINNNCYYNRNVDMEVDFANNTGGTSAFCELNGPMGALYNTWSGYRSGMTGFDTNSFYKNPALTFNLVPTDSDCKNFGAFQGDPFSARMVSMGNIGGRR